MARFVCHVGAKVPADDAMPGGVVPFVELFLDVCGNVLEGDRKRIIAISMLRSKRLE